MTKLMTAGYRSFSPSARSPTLFLSARSGTSIEITSSVIAMAKTPSLNASTRLNSTPSRG